MTEILKDLMHDRADTLDAPDLDVLAMVREGNRRVTRRRTAIIGAGVAAAVVSALAVPALLTEDRQVAREPVPIAASFTAHQPSYAIGSTVHIDGRSIDVGHDVFAYVQTTAGVVFSDQDGQVWANDGTQTVGVGTIDAEHPHLEADGARAAWVQPDADTAAPVFTTYDQATGETTQTAYEVRGGASEYSPAMFAVDGDEVWFRDDRGAIRWNVTTGQQTEEGAPVGLEIDDVKAGVIAHSLPNADGGDVTYYTGTSFGDGDPVTVWNGLALSPDGTHLAGESESDTPALFDTRTGAMTSIEVPGYSFFVTYGWVDANTYVGLGLNKPYDTSETDLLECEVGGTCTVTGEDIGSIADGLVVPLGIQMDD